MKAMVKAQCRRAPSAGRGGLRLYRASGRTAQDVRALLRPPPAPQRLCTECEGQARRAPSANVHAVTDVSSTVRTGLAGGAAPLPSGLRQHFEPRFGHNFADVRLHTDTAAAVSASALSARAYTFGRDIAFGAGEYDPHSHAGRRLIAHELTHVVQQSGTGGLPGPSSSAGAPASASGAAHVARAPNGTVQCDGALEAWKDDLAKRKAKVLSLAKDGNATISLFGDSTTGLMSGYQMTQKFKGDLAADADASRYAVVQWIKGDMYEDRAGGKVYWPASMGLYGRKNTDPWHFTDWIIDTPDADPRFGSDRGVGVAVPKTSFSDSPGVMQKSGALPAKLTWVVDARVGIYPWGTRIPTDIAGWESQKPEPFREVTWGWTVTVKPDQKSLDVEAR